MDHHRPVLQQRVQAHAIGYGGNHFIDGQNLEGADHEGIENQEEQLNGRDDRDYPRQDVAMFATCGEHHDCAVSGQQPAPEQQRPFLPAPPGRELVEQRHAAVSVGSDIGHAEVADDERVDEDSRRGCHQHPDREHASLRAERQKRLVA